MGNETGGESIICFKKDFWGYAKKLKCSDWKGHGYVCTPDTHVWRTMWTGLRLTLQQLWLSKLSSTGILRDPQDPALPTCSPHSWESGPSLTLHLLYPASNGHFALRSIRFSVLHALLCLWVTTCLLHYLQNDRFATGWDFVIACAILVDLFIVVVSEN